MTSLEQRMELPEEREKLITILNGVELYSKIVRRCHYQRIGIQVQNNGENSFAYTSFNDSSGKVTAVEKGLHQPEITGYVEEYVLTEILDKIEELQAHPTAAAFHYAGKFKIRPKSAYWKIMKALI